MSLPFGFICIGEECALRCSSLVQSVCVKGVCDSHRTLSINQLQRMEGTRRWANTLTRFSVKAGLTPPQKNLNSNRFHIISWEQCVFINCLCLSGKKIINQKNSQPDLSWEISQNEKHGAYIFPLHETRSVTPCEEAAVLTCQRAWSSQSTPSSKSCLL